MFSKLFPIYFKNIYKIYYGGYFNDLYNWGNGKAS